MAIKSIVLVIFALFSCALANDVFVNQIETMNDTTTCSPSFCSNLTMQSADVITYCKAKNYTVKDRCCIDANSTITGLDYSSCQIQKLTSAMNSLVNTSIQFVEIFDIRNNALTECDTDAFAGLVKLNILYIAPICECPGKSYSWYNITADSCFNRKDICKTTYTNVNCTTNSNCVDNGPGNFLCLCKMDYHGYKCLNKGTFPTLTFTLAICLSTVILCGILWHTQRRHVKKE